MPSTSGCNGYVISVVTPTFNRAHLLGRLYASLCEQTFQDFEWLIVDDGSTDTTRTVVEGWLSEGRLQIRYIAQNNSGKHVALNRAFLAAAGTFCAVIDSDDWYVPRALERLLAHWRAIPADQVQDFANVEGLRAYADGGLIGTRFPAEVVDSDTFEIRYVFGVLGDTVGMYRTDVLRKFPFPENLGRFVPEGLVWSRIASDYRSRFVNEVLGYVEFQPGGLSDRRLADDVAAAPALALFYRELATTSRWLPLRARLAASAHYVCSALHARAAGEIVRARLPMALATVPLGTALYVRELLTLAVRDAR